MKNLNNTSTRWRFAFIKKRATKKLKPIEIGALATFAIQLVAESRGDDIPLQEVADRTAIPLQRLQELATCGQFSNAYFILNEEEGEQWYVPISDLQT